MSKDNKHIHTKIIGTFLLLLLLSAPVLQWRYLRVNATSEGTFQPTELNPGEQAKLSDGVQDEQEKEKRRIVETLHPDRSSPRNLWHSFIKLTNAYRELIADDGLTPENIGQATYLEMQITRCFDTREIAPSVRTDTAMEAAVFMREAIARFDAEHMAEELPDRQDALAEVKAGLPPVWRVGQSLITIIYIREGDLANQFRFGESSIEWADEAFYFTRHLDYMDPKISGFYEDYTFMPGWMIPNEWVENLPSFMHREFLDNMIWQWIGGFLVLGLVALMNFGIFTCIRWATRDLSSSWRLAAWLLVPVYVLYTMYLAVNIIDDQIFWTGFPLKALRFLQYLVMLCVAVVTVFLIAKLATSFILNHPRVNEANIDAQLIRFGIRIFSIALSVILVIEGMYMLGFSLSTVLAGAGVTGLAIALAAQESLKNIFGSIMLLLDKPFRVGERIKVRGHDGTVKEIGLRSTKIQLLNGHMTTIPNDDVAKADVENIGVRPFIRRTFQIGILFDTPPAKIDEAVKIIRDILTVKEDDPDTHANDCIQIPGYEPKVFFTEIGSDSLNIYVSYWYHPPEWWDYTAHAQYVNRQIMHRFAEAGIEMAFPTQTVHVQSGESQVVEPAMSAEVFEPDEPESPQGESDDASDDLAPPSPREKPQGPPLPPNMREHNQ